MGDFLSQPTTQVFLSVLVLLILTSVAYHFLVRLRDSSRDTFSDDLNSLTKFEEMRAAGEISEAEFRSIQSALKSAKELPK